MTNPTFPNGAQPLSPSPGGRLAPKVSPAGWLVPLAALIAVIGLFTPWFDPTGTKDGVTILKAESALHSWEDGKIGLIAPILLVVVSIGVVGLLLGRSVSRFESSAKGPVVAAARTALVAGAVTVVAVVVAWFLVPGQFSNVPADAGGSWEGAGRLGIEMSRGPQLGYWLTAVAGVLALIGGGVMLLTAPKQAASGPSPWAPAGQQFGPGQPGPGQSAPWNAGAAQPGPGNAGAGQPGPWNAGAASGSPAPHPFPAAQAPSQPSFPPQTAPAGPPQPGESAGGRHSG